ncbi:MAG: hypothetical protein ACI8T6_000965 [Candidatus Poseidoniaceae archaeon]|jgi:hypothetical protein
MNARSSLPSLLMTALLLVALAPLSSVAAVPTEASEFYYGVEYDWSSVDTDLENFTGLDIPEILGEVMLAADDAGFNLIIGQLQTGASNVYVHHSEDITPQTIQDNNGDDVSVWSRTEDVTLRHGILADSILQTDWDETTFGSDPTSFDIDIVQSLEQVLTVDMTYTEYLDDNSNLVGADMEFSMQMSAAIGLNIDALFEGGGENFPVDFDSEISIGYSITDSTSKWRLDSPNSIYTDLSSNDELYWECDDCGDIAGDYTGAVDYSFSVNGIPTEDFGLDAGEFDLEISDSLTDSGTFDMEAFGEWDFRMGETLTVDLGDGDGLTTQVQSCETCPPGSPLMFMMMGYVLAGSGEAFAEQIGEDLGEGITDGIEDWFGLSEGNTDGNLALYVMNAEEAVNSGSDDALAHVTMNQGSDINWAAVIVQISIDGGAPVMCGAPGTTGNMCTLVGFGDFDQVWSVGEGVTIMDDGDLCPSGQSCSVSIMIINNINGKVLAHKYLYLTGHSPAGSTGKLIGNIHSWGDTMTIQTQLVGGTPLAEVGDLAEFTCDDESMLEWEDVNDGNNDCTNGEDESDGTNLFTCNDGSTIDWSLVNDYTADCTTAEDEGVKNHYTLQMTLFDDVGNPLSSIESTICESTCDSNQDWSSDWSEDTGISVPTGYGETTMCMTATLSETGAASPLLELPQTCDTYWTGPELNDHPSIWSDGLEVTFYGAFVDYDNEGGATMTISVVDPNQAQIYSDSVAIDGTESWYSLEESVSVLEEGNYCVTFALVEEGETAPYASQNECTFVEDNAPDVSERIEAVFGAIAESGLEDVLEQFGMNLDERLKTVKPFEEFPYNDGMWAPLWSNEHAAMVGVGVYVISDNGSHTLAGPETQGYTDAAPAKMSIRYLTGLDANTATNGMEEATTINDIVEVENHNLDDIAEDLAAAGIDVGNLTLPQSSNNQTTGDEDPTPPTAEELAEDAGLLPFLSPISMVAVIALAGVVAGSRRDEDQHVDE